MDGLRSGSSPPRQIRANAVVEAGELSYLSLRFKIGEPSCLATLKMT